jgi:putative hydroxymethylpyrimidine transport system substrate-binding protein
LPRFAHSPAALDRKRFRRFAEFLHAQNLIARVPADELYMAEIG